MTRTGILAMLLISTPLTAQQSLSIPTIPQIAVSARGEVRVNPDRAAIQISVHTRAPTAAAAAAENARKQKAVIDALRALGLAANDISTVNYNVFPEQRYEANREPVLIGYNVTNTVHVEVKTLTLIGPVIDAALAKGANMVTSLQFLASNTENARREAITSAIRKARADADAAAQAAGGSIGGLLEINIGGYFTPPPRPMMEMQARAMSQDVATPIAPGEQTVSVDITTRWSFAAGAR